MSPLIMFKRHTNTVSRTTTPTTTVTAVAEKTTMSIVVILMSIVAVVVVAVVVVFIAEVMVFVVVEAVVIVEVVAVCMVGVTVFEVVEVVEVDVQTVDDIDPGDSLNMSTLVALEFTQETPQSVWSKDFARRNISFMLATVNTSHTDRSWLKECAL